MVGKPRALTPYNPLTVMLLAVEVEILKEVALFEIFIDDFLREPDGDFTPSVSMKLYASVVEKVLEINSYVLDKVVKRISRLLGATMATRAILEEGDEDRFSISYPNGTSRVFTRDIRKGEFYRGKQCDGITFMSAKLFASVQWLYQMATRFGIYGSLPEYNPKVASNEDKGFDATLTTRSITRISMSDWKELGFRPSIEERADCKVLILTNRMENFKIRVVEEHTIEKGEILIYNYDLIRSFMRRLERWSLGHLFEISVLDQKGMVKGHVMVQKTSPRGKDLTVFEINIKKEVTLIPNKEVWIAMAPTPKKSYGFSHFDWQSIINILLFQSEGNRFLIEVLNGTTRKVKKLLNSFLDTEVLKVLEESPDFTGPEAARLFVQSFNFKRYVEILKELTGDVDNDNEVKAMTLLLEGVKSGKVKVQTLLAKGLTLVNHLLKQLLTKMEYEGASGYVVCDPVYLLSGGMERSILSDEIAVAVFKGQPGRSIAHRRPTMLEQVSCKVYNVMESAHVVDFKKLTSFGIVWNQNSGAILANSETVLELVKVLDFDQDDCVEFHTGLLGEMGDISLKALPVIGRIEPRPIQDYKSEEMCDDKIVRIKNKDGQWERLMPGFDKTWTDMRRATYRLQELKVTEIPGIAEVVGCMMRLMAVISEPKILSLNLVAYKPREGEPNIMSDIRFIFSVPVSAALDMEKAGKVYRISEEVKACTGRLYRFLRFVPFWYSTPTAQNMRELLMFDSSKNIYVPLDKQTDKFRFISELSKFTYKGVDDDKSIPCFNPKDETHVAFMQLFRTCNSVVSWFSLFGTLAQFKDNLGDKEAMKGDLVELIQSTRSFLLFPNSRGEVDNRLTKGYVVEPVTDDDGVYGAYLITSNGNPNFQIVGNQMNSSNAFYSIRNRGVSHNNFKLPDLASVLQKIDSFYRKLPDTDDVLWMNRSIACGTTFITAMYSYSSKYECYNIPYGDVIPGRATEKASTITLISGKKLEVGDFTPKFGDVSDLMKGVVNVEYPSFINGFQGNGQASKNRHPNEDPSAEAKPIASVLCKSTSNGLVLAQEGEEGTVYVPVLGIATKDNKYLHCPFGLKYKLFRSFLAEFKSYRDEHDGHHANTISLVMVAKALLDKDSFRFGIRRSYQSFFMNDPITRKEYCEDSDLNAIRFLLKEMVGNAASVPTNGINRMSDDIDLSNGKMIDVVGHLNIPSFNNLYQEISDGNISLKAAFASIELVCYRNRVASRGAGMLSHVATIAMIMESGYTVEDIYNASNSRYPGHELSQLIKSAYRREGDE